ncbi:hypothetical protein LWI28_014748 [Acer negundo]|uniref:Alcohol dehydrogenase-like C-terminal domain-containing protein n=1 Tax=Acer negundo TaxID=4023 RepID=A0AAD5NLR7_ACENE|nr:hypothetical protein LWI28_014748 [Acer negundo]
MKTYGGYSDIIVVDQNYVLRIPDNMPLDAGAPLLCAGITVYSPMVYYGMNQPGKHLGVAGLGGLGHVAVKIGKAFGLKVTVISTSPKKESEAIDRLGADSFLVSTDPAKFKAAIGTMDYIIDTIAAVHALAPLLSLLNVNGKLVTVGLPERPLELPIFPLVIGRRLIGGSNVGGIKETQEMLDFCSKHNITADIELIRIDELNKAMERLAKSDVSKSMEKHKEHLKIALSILKQNQLYVKRSKCEFRKTKLEYLGHIISATGVSANQRKIQGMQNWPTRRTIKALRGFLGLTGYYRKFMKSYVIISKPLTELLKKNCFDWGEAADTTFEALKMTMTTTHVLALPDFSQIFTVDTDACNV